MRKANKRGQAQKSEARAYGARLRGLRSRHYPGHTMGEVAALMGVDVPSLCRWEGDVRVPSKARREMLAAFYGEERL